MIPAHRCPSCGLVFLLTHRCWTPPVVTAADLADADRLEVEYVETPSGDVWGTALVSPRGDVLCVLDDDGLDVWPVMTWRERALVESRVRAAREERRAAA